jgi:hypothetical protein
MTAELAEVRGKDRWWEDGPRPPGWPEGLRPPVWVQQSDGGMWMVETVDSLPYCSCSRGYGVWCVDWADFGVVAHLIWLATNFPNGA